MSILINKAGILTTVQDLGRNGFRRFGINQNGAMDKIAVRLINSLLGNDENAPVLEMHFPASEMIFEEDVCFALGGADYAAQLNGAALENWRIYSAAKGSALKFTHKTFGNRAYLAVKGGFAVKYWLNSASTNLKAQIGGIEGRKLQIGDRLFFSESVERQSFIVNRQSSIANYRVSNSLIPFYSKFPTVRVVAGAEFELLNAQAQENFYSENFTITQNSDRMGFRLHGAALQLQTPKEMISSAVNFGTVQLLPGGQMIVLMADHQTSGGYPRIASVIPTDLPLLAQLGTKDLVAFHPITTLEAENLLIGFENDLNLLKTAVFFL